MRIQHNIPALNAWRQGRATNKKTAGTIEKLSSGFRINRAGDDAAGLAISEKMRGQIRGLGMAEQNASHGIDLIQTAEGGLNETHAILQRLRELAVQSSNGTYQDEDREQLTREYSAAMDEIDRISESTHYNGIKLLDGSLSKDGTAVAAKSGNVPYNALAAPGGAQSFAAPVGAGQAEIQEIQPLGGMVTPFALVPEIELSKLSGNISGTGWTFNNNVLTITGSGDDYILSGKAAAGVRVVVKSGVTANIYLNKASIETNVGSAIDISGATVNMTIVGNNTLTSNSENKNTTSSAGIRTTGGTLTIKGGGSLTVKGGVYGAAIGGGKGGAGGTITITGNVTVNATGGVNGAAIGGGKNGAGGNITISGNAKVTATSTGFGAGIGGGESAATGNITISGGTVNATGAILAPGIGGNGGTILITGGTITAYGASSAAGIGSGDGSAISVKSPAVTITGGIVTAQGGSSASGIGGGTNTTGGVVKISGGKIVAKGNGASDIGGGTNGAAGSTEITGGTVDAPYIAGQVKSPNGTVTYKVAVSGVVFAPNTNISYTIDGASHSFKTDPDGTLALWLPTADSGKEIIFVVGGVEYKGILEVNANHGNSMTLQGPDTTAPTLSNGSGTRTDEATGKVAFTSDEGGRYYYLVKKATEGEPTVDEVIAANKTNTCINGKNIINITGLPNGDAQKVYVVVVDGSDNTSDLLTVNLGEYVTRDVTVTLPGVTFPPGTGITVTIDGEDKTVQTDGNGDLILDLTDGTYEIEISYDDKTYTGEVKVNGSDVKTTLTEKQTKPQPEKPKPGPKPETGSSGKGLVLQIGANGGADQRVTVQIECMDAAHIGIQDSSGIVTTSVRDTSISTRDAANAAIDVLAAAINQVSGQRAELGAMQNRLEHTLNNLGVTRENLTDAESVIRDADMAKEMMDFTKLNILGQAAQAMLAQANQLPQGVLSMLR